MALRQLAGPFPLVNNYRNAPGTFNISDPVSWQWHPGLGIVIDIPSINGSSDGFGRNIMTLDGVFQVIGESNRNLGLGWWVPNKQMLFASGDAKEHIYDRRCLLVYEESVASTGQPQHVNAFWPNNYLRFAGPTYIYYSSPFIHREPGGQDPMNIGAAMGMSDGSLWAGRIDEEAFIAQRDGPHCRFYNLNTQQFTSPTMKVGVTPVQSGIMFAQEYGVIVTLHKDPTWNLRIWSLDVQPTTLSAPILIDGQEKVGHVATYQVRLTGADGEPCAGEFIEWILSGVGALTKNQSTTDENGYATTQVRYGLSDVGSSYLEADCRC